MDDLISRRAAYEALTAYYHHTTDMQHAALYDALNRVPSAQPEKRTENTRKTHGVFLDVIDRQAAIDALSDGALVNYQAAGHNNGLVKAIDIIKGLPSAQPEIVRCKDCRWWDKSEDSPFGYCMAIKHGYMSEHWEIGIYRRYKGDFYCADAERRTGRAT